MRLGLLAIAALVAASAVWGMADAALREPRVWGLLGFEAVTLIAAVVGVFLGLGKPREAPALAAACVGATFFAAATLGRFSALVTRADGTVSEGQVLGRLIRDPVFEGRVLAAVLFGAAAVVFALGGDRRAWRRLIVGGALAVPVVAAAAWLLVGSGLNWLMAPVESFAGAVRIVVAVVGGLAMAILASVSVHSIIGAFEGRLPPWPGEERTPERKPVAANEPA
jgi:hypothetical protein